MIGPITKAALAVLLSSGAALAAPPAPDLSEAAIEAATLPDWEARVEALAESAEAAAEQEPAEETDATSAPADAVPAPSDAAEAAGDEAAASEGETSAQDAADRPDPFLIRMQVLLDRAHVSPGVIDGLAGGNTEKAVRAYEEMRGLTVDGRPDADFWEILAADGGKAMKTYTLTEEDIDGRYVDDIPSDYGQLAKMEWLGFRGPAEMLAERFHMDEDLLRTLNPKTGFEKAGETILVADTGPEPETKVARIVVDKAKGELIAYDDKDEIVLMDPATIGSEDTPSPSGTVKVNGSAPDPTYAYNPAKNFQQGDNDEKLTIPAGPNGPVGSMWIDLSKPTYGIHGTPEPSKIDKTASHGCVRLTNWDAAALSKLVQPGKTVVEFKGVRRTRAGRAAAALGLALVLAATSLGQARDALPWKDANPLDAPARRLDKARSAQTTAPEAKPAPVESPAAVPVPEERPSQSGEPAPDAVPPPVEAVAKPQFAPPSPAEKGEAQASDDPAATADRPVSEIPVPDERPADDPAAGAGTANRPPEPVAPSEDAPNSTENLKGHETAITPAASVLAAAAVEDAERCEAELTRRGVGFTVEETISEGDCGVLRPVRLKRLSSGIDVSPDTQFLCRAALALDDWMTQSVVPAAEASFGDDRLAEFRHASTYVCRPRASETGISEHARGSAVDIGAFVFKSGREIGVAGKDAGTPEATFLARVRAGACGPFRTVLGPGTDADHAAHFHLDIAARAGGATYCK